MVTEQDDTVELVRARCARLNAAPLPASLDSFGCYAEVLAPGIVAVRGAGSTPAGIFDRYGIL